MSSAVRTATLSLVAIAALARMPAAQQPAMPIGRTARIVPAASGPIHRGRLLLVAKDTVVLGNGQRQEWYALASGDRLEVMVEHRSWALPGGLIGGAVGAVIGSTVKRHMCTNGAYIPYRSATYCGLTSTQGALLGGGIGLVVGALVGSRFGPTRWETVPLDQHSALGFIVVPSQDRGFVLGVSLTL